MYTIYIPGKKDFALKIATQKKTNQLSIVASRPLSKSFCIAFAISGMTHDLRA